MIYHETAVLSECFSCGETRECTRFTADSPEAETGYRDEYDLCAECLEKR
jgi:hypothetical protein